MSSQRSLRHKYFRIARGAVNGAETQHFQHLQGKDEPICNRSGNPPFSSILATRLQRRQVLRGTPAAAVTSMFAGPELNGLKTRPASANSALLGFSEIPVSDADTIELPAATPPAPSYPTANLSLAAFPATA